MTLNPINLTFQPWLVAALTAILAALILTVAFERVSLTACHAELANLSTQLKTAEDANTAMARTLAAQSQALQDWQGKAVAQANAAQEASQALKQAVDARDKIAAALIAAQAKDKQRPGCVALLALDLAGSCPAYAEAVRDRAK